MVVIVATVLSGFMDNSEVPVVLRPRATNWRHVESFQTSKEDPGLQKVETSEAQFLIIGPNSGQALSWS